MYCFLAFSKSQLFHCILVCYCHPATKYIFSNLIYILITPQTTVFKNFETELSTFLLQCHPAQPLETPSNFPKPCRTYVNISNQTLIQKPWHYFVLWEYDDKMYFDASLITTEYFTKETSHLYIR